VYGAVKAQPIALPVLAKKPDHDSSAVAKDVKTLERYGILRTELKPNPGHGKVKMIEAPAPSIRFVTTI
jgi:predicted transcriptional regulator